MDLGLGNWILIIVLVFRDFKILGKFLIFLGLFIKLEGVVIVFEINIYF